VHANARTFAPARVWWPVLHILCGGVKHTFRRMTTAITGFQYLLSGNIAAACVRDPRLQLADRLARQEEWRRTDGEAENLLCPPRRIARRSASPANPRKIGTQV